MKKFTINKFLKYLYDNILYILSFLIIIVILFFPPVRMFFIKILGGIGALFWLFAFYEFAIKVNKKVDSYYKSAYIALLIMICMAAAAYCFTLM